MLLKTYRGPDLKAALKQARDELGPGALVLGTTEQPGPLGLSVVEVTVAVAREPQEPERAPDPTLAALSQEVRDLRRLLDEARSRQRLPQPPPKPAPKPAAKPSTRKIAPRPAPSSVTVEALVASGLSRDLALRFTGMSHGHKPHPRGAKAIAGATAECIRGCIEFGPVPTHQRCVFVVGPPGSGKTTTVAKLAARAALAGRPVFFGIADGDRIGGFEQAEVYSRYIGAQAARIESADDLLRALGDATDRGLVLVDTCGVGATDDERAQEILKLRAGVPDAAVALLVPAGLHHVEASRVFDRFAPLEPTCVGLSRVDDACRPGELITALASRRIPLAFFTNGHTVPNDLKRASPHGLAALLLRAGKQRAPQTEVKE